MARVMISFRRAIKSDPQRLYFGKAGSAPHGRLLGLSSVTTYIMPSGYSAQGFDGARAGGMRDKAREFPVDVKELVID